MIDDEDSEQKRRERQQSRKAASDMAEGLALIISPFAFMVALYTLMAVLEGIVVVLEVLNDSTLGLVVMGVLFCLGVGVVGAVLEK